MRQFAGISQAGRRWGCWSRFFSSQITRSQGEGAVFDLVRETLRKGSLLRAVLAECESTIQYVINGKDRQLCTQTVRTRNWALKKIAEEAEHVG